MKRIYSLALLLLLSLGSAFAVNVSVQMNTVSKTMTLEKKDTGAKVDTGDPSGTTYTFTADPGKYVLTAIASDGTTVNGSIELDITGEEQTFSILTCTIYASNSGWVAGEDYTIDVEVKSKTAVRTITLGQSTTAGRKTFLALNGDSYTARLIPSAQHTEYMTLLKAATVTFNANVYGEIPVGAEYSVTLPKDAEIFLGTKMVHFTDFIPAEVLSTESVGSEKTVTFRLADKQVYNYRTWKEGGLTQGGYFTMSTDAAQRPQLAFTSDDYQAFGQKTVKHDVAWNQGYETGDIFLNINERGHLRMNVGETFDAHAMRTWELTDNSTNNYFLEPDFHYTVVGLDGKPSTGVIEIDNADTSASPWSRIKAVGEGTAIVLVTYDAIGLNYYSGTTKKAFLGGEYWSAIWPENTGVFVVTVGGTESSVQPNMFINEEYNAETMKLAGKNIDAEHDVFYYLDSEVGMEYTFTPVGAAKVEVAHPVIGEETVTYGAFSDQYVSKRADGSYSILLKEGRQIVRLTDEAGNAVYQVITAKPCHRDIVNASREGSKIFQPGDKVKVQYSGLRHPANKLAGIYNMSAFVTYNGIPNGSSLVLGSNQYTFGSAPSAQAVTIDIPEDYDIAQDGDIVMSEGVIQVSGFGDPIGNHRFIDRNMGRSANFTAIAHKTYFGQLPDVRIALSEVKNFPIRTVANVEDAEVSVSYNGKILEADAEGTYTGTYGDYAVTAQKEGFRFYSNTFSIGDDAEGEQVFNIELVAAAEGAWDGKSVAEPQAVDGVYQIASGAELAWLAKTVNEGATKSDAVLVADIDLADYPWTPIGGTTSAKAYAGTFLGNGHCVKGLAINSTATYQGLFAYIMNAKVSDLTVEGSVTSSANYAAGIVAYANASEISRCVNRADVSGKQYTGGVVAYVNGASSIDRCANYGNVSGSGTYAGGVTSYLFMATGSLTNCFNAGEVSATGYAATIVANTNANAVVKNNLNIGVVKCSAATTGNVHAATTPASAKTNNYVIEHYANGQEYETVVTAEQLASGEVAYLLGEAWGQCLGSDDVPVIGGLKVFETEGGYTNNNPEYDGVINFEDVDLKGEQYYKGADGAGLFVASDVFSFLTTYDAEYDYWEGFAVSATTGSDFNGYGTPSEFNSCIGGGMESRQFAVGYFSQYNHMMSGECPQIYATKPYKPEYLYVNNAAYAYQSMLHGDAYAKKFTEDDYFVLTITGRTLEGDETGHVDVYLAKDGKIMNEWTKVDLSELGAVDHLDFSMDSSDQSYGFINTPTYFCMDNMKAELTDDVPTAVETVRDNTAKNAPQAVFTADGVRVEKLLKGLNIIRMSDGSTKRIIVR